MRTEIRLAVMAVFIGLLSAFPHPARAFEWRKETNKVLAPGEKLCFSIKWQFITVGYATMEIMGIDDVFNRKAFHIYTEARSSSFFDTFYKVRDTNESWMDTESLCSLKFVSIVNESKHDKTETLILDQENRKFTLVENNKSGPIPQWVQDVLSCLYYLRTKDLAVGQAVTIDAHQGDESWPLIIKIVKREKIRVPAGEFDCFLVEPAVREGAGIFQAKGKIWVWLTADERKVPVKMSSKIPIGSVEAVLTDMKIPLIDAGR